jgi:hypothetical protein
VLKQVTLPENTVYAFDYYPFDGSLGDNPNRFQLKTVTLPVGNRLAFTYQTTTYKLSDDSVRVIPNLKTVFHDNIEREDYYTCVDYSQDYDPSYMSALFLDSHLV